MCVCVYVSVHILYVHTQYNESCFKSSSYAFVFAALADPLCQFKPDGKYPLRDTFKYLVCKGSKGNLFRCPKNQVFIAREDRCRTVTVQDQSMSYCRSKCFVLKT